jgi:hypothetical protein
LINTRHRWYKYKESFDQNIVVKAIEECSLSSDDVIIDPFNGSGTVTLTASTKGYKSIGIEVNPFASFLSSTKNLSPSIKEFNTLHSRVLKGVDTGLQSPLTNFSTFSQNGKNKKWLFNPSILSAFEGGWRKALMSDTPAKNLTQLALIGAAMDNSNAVRDGKCLKYKNNWEQLKYDKYSFLNSLERRLKIMQEDIEGVELRNQALIVTGDARQELNNYKGKPYKLCVTSPPYLNSFDYTDLYRPELFLGEFIKSNVELQFLRTKTLRSHVEIKIQTPQNDDFGVLYKEVIGNIKSKEHLLWDKQIPIMIQA